MVSNKYLNGNKVVVEDIKRHYAEQEDPSSPLLQPHCIYSHPPANYSNYLLLLLLLLLNIKTERVVKLSDCDFKVMWL